MRISLLLFFSFSFLLLNAQQIQNPSFEIPSQQTITKTTAWSSYANSFRIERTQKEYYSGDSAISIKQQGVDEHGSFYQEIKVQPEKARYFQLSAFIKTQEVSDGFAGIWVNILKEGNQIDYKSMRGNGPIGTNNWQRYKLFFWIPAEATSIRIGGTLLGKGQAWFDEYQIEEVNYEKLEASEVARQYLDEFFDIVMMHSLRKNLVDWEWLRQSTYKKAKEAQTTSDCYKPIEYALAQLGDQHSFLVKPETVKLWSSKASQQSNTFKFEFARGELIENQFGYISLPGITTGNKEVMQNFADSLQQLIAQIDEYNPKGWIVDLRDNGGGNCWPMLAGIGPILGEGISGYFSTPDAQKSAWSYQAGAARQNEKDIIKISGNPYQLKRKMPPVAVLTHGYTASSGEIIAVSFIGRPNTKSFGKPTRGLSTGNRGFPLSDGALLQLTTTIYADRAGKLYGKKIKPDILVQAIKNTEKDPTLEKALEWLRVQGE